MAVISNTIAAALEVEEAQKKEARRLHVNKQRREKKQEEKAKSKVEVKAHWFAVTIHEEWKRLHKEGRMSFTDYIACRALYLNTEKK